MEQTHNSTAKFWQQMIHPSPEQREAEREGYPFFLVITILLVSVTVILFPAFSARFIGWQWAAFIFLLPTHVALHWISPRFLHDKRLRIAYLAVQGMFAFALVWLTASPELALALFASLIAETIGSLGVTWLTAVAVIGYLLLTLLGFLMLGGTDLLQEWDSPLVSTLSLLIIFMILYRRQTESREQTQTLLSELETAHRQLADYATQVESLTLAEERQRMARELHDTLAQGLSGVVLQLEAVKNHLENGRLQRAETIVNLAMDRARGSLVKARLAIDDLREDSTEISFAHTIRQKAERFAHVNNIPCHLTLTLTEYAPIRPALAVHARRIIGEGLTNVAAHAQAANVWIDVSLEEDDLLIAIKDDGIGFDAETASEKGHYGLKGMRERAQLTNGAIEIESQPGSGTRIEARLPLGNTR